MTELCMYAAGAQAGAYEKMSQSKDQVGGPISNNHTVVTESIANCHALQI